MTHPTRPDLTGQGAVITGASRGIGAATARHLADLGAHVTLAARSGDAIGDLVERIVDAGGQARAVPCDVADRAAVKSLIEGAFEATGRLDLLVNNAGLIDPIAPLAESDPEAWGHVIDVNVKGVYYGMRYAMPLMQRQGGGTIVNISSGAASGALEGWSHYSASKAAVLRLTATAHNEAGGQVRILGLSPGTVATRMQEEIRASGVNRVSQMPWEAHIPPETVADAIAFLTTPGADPWLGGDVSLREADVKAAMGID